MEATKKPMTINIFKNAHPYLLELIKKSPIMVNDLITIMLAGSSSQAKNQYLRQNPNGTVEEHKKVFQQFDDCVHACVTAILHEVLAHDDEFRKQIEQRYAKSGSIVSFPVFNSPEELSNDKPSA